MLVILCGSLELLVGGRIAAFVYLGAMNSNVPNGLFLLPALRILYPHVWAETVQYVDVGASLGIMGCLGGLAAVLVPKAKWAVIGLSIVGSVVGAAYIHNLFGIDHAFSILLGFLICSHYRRMESRKLVLIPLEPSPEIRRTGTG